MRNFRKSLCLLLSVCLLVSLAACGKTEEPVVVPVPDVEIQTEPTQEIVETVPPAETEPIVEETEPIEIKPETWTTGTLMSKVLEVSENEECITTYCEVKTGPLETDRSYNSTSTAIMHNVTGEFYVLSESHSIRGEDETINIDEVHILAATNEEYPYKSYTKSYYKSPYSESDEKNIYWGHANVGQYSTILTVLSAEPYVKLLPEIQSIDSQKYYVLEGLDVNSANPYKVTFFVNADTYQMHSAYVYSGFVSDDEYKQLMTFEFSYEMKEFPAVEGFDGIEPEIHKYHNTNFESFFALKNDGLKPVSEMVIRVDNTAICVGDSAAILFDSQFTDLVLDDLEVFNLDAISSEGTDITADYILQPNEFATCSLEKVVTEDSVSARLDAEQYIFIINNPTDAPLALHDCTILVMGWLSTFADVEVKDLSLFDFKVLFGDDYESYIDNEFMWMLEWDKGEYSVWVEYSMLGSCIMVQSNDGPNIMGLTLGQNTAQ